MKNNNKYSNEIAPHMGDNHDDRDDRDNHHDNDRNGDRGTGTITKPKVKTKKPSMYKVLLLNDDYTPMDFVIYVLQKYFRLSIEDATDVMLQVHTKGVGVCGVFTFEVAETKVTHVLDLAKKHEHPLQCTLEEA